MAASRISLFSQFSNYWSMFGISIRCHVCHATTSGIQKKREQKKPTKNEKKNQFSTFYLFQPQFSFIRLSHLLRYICVYVFSNSNKVLLCVSHWIRSNLYHSHAKNTHSFIRIALKHFVTCNHLSKSFCPFCL